MLDEAEGNDFEATVEVFLKCADMIMEAEEQNEGVYFERILARYKIGCLMMVPHYERRSYLGDTLCAGGEQRKLLELEYCQLGESLMR